MDFIYFQSMAGQLFGALFKAIKVSFNLLNSTVSNPLFVSESWLLLISLLPLKSKYS